jgi:hypothetical protein
MKKKHDPVLLRALQYIVSVQLNEKNYTKILREDPFKRDPFLDKAEL